MGGLVGRHNSGGSITSSYATGDADGGTGEKELCGRPGGAFKEIMARITSSYATGDPSGGTGRQDRVGGLVGYQNNSSITSTYATITSTYATGNPNGGAGDRNAVGGLVGRQYNGSITSSYATGNPNGGSGPNGSVDRLVGYQEGGSITSSYGLGTPINGGFSNGLGTPPSGVSSASGLTPANSGDSDSNIWSTDAWAFGDNTQAPALKYVDNYILGDHDNDASTPNTYAYTCTPKTVFLPPLDIICDTTLLPEQSR